MTNVRLCMSLLLLGSFTLCHAATSERWLLRKMLFAGNSVLSTESLEKQSGLLPGKSISSEKVDFAAGKLLSLYRQRGYWDIAISTQIAQGVGRLADVAFVVQEGDLYALGRVTIEGNHRVSEQVIRRELRVEEFKPFSQSQLYEGHQRLFLTGYFDSIDIVYSTTTSHHINVAIRVKERATRFIKGSLGYGTQSKERLSLGIDDANFLGNGRRLELKGIYSGFLTEPAQYETKRVELNFRQPYVFNSEAEATTSLSKQWDRRETYDSISTLWESAIGKRFSSDIVARMRYRFKGTRLTRVSPDAVTDQGRFTSISALGPVLSYDNTNDPFMPRLGWRINSYFEKGLSLWAGDLDFQKMETKVGRFETLWKSWTLFTGLQIGIERPDHRQDTIPIFERFTLGGANTVRGYGERDLGPKDSRRDPLGGDAYGVVNLEVRRPLYKRLHGVLFLDGGQLWTRPDGQRWPTITLRKLDDLRYGTGGGIRLMTPVGALRLEIGYKLNPPAGTSGFLNRTALHFSIGEVF